ncbi:hypothetical protein Hanom_Chr12g01153451 [Helianthus anomalus]
MWIEICVKISTRIQKTNSRLLTSLPIKKPPSHHSFSRNFCYKSNNHNRFTVIVSPAITLIQPLLGILIAPSL